MPKPRKALRLRQEEKSLVVRMRHPLSQKVLRIWLGKYPDDGKTAQAKLDTLNRVFLDPAQWHDPQGLSEELSKVWRDASLGVQVKGGKVTVDGATVNPTPGQMAAMAAAIETLQRQLAESNQQTHKYKKLYEASAGRKARIGPSPTLRQALDTWKLAFQGRDSEHTKIVGYDLERFVDKFGEDTEVDSLDGCEKQIDDWLRSLTIKAKKDDVEPPRRISAGRRAQIRLAVLRFLEDSGLKIARKSVAAPGKKEVRKDRGAVRWLEADQATELLKHLEQPWKDAFDIQRQIGLRPSELPTLKKGDFSPDMSELALSPLGVLTLKTGPRKITLSNFPDVIPVFKRMMKSATTDALFTSDEKPWVDSQFMKTFNAALKGAKDAVNVVAKQEGKEALAIGFKIDCRIGRRTCASLLIRDEKNAKGKIVKRGRSIESVAALLGDDPATIREHYGHLQSHEA